MKKFFYGYSCFPALLSDALCIFRLYFPSLLLGLPAIFVSRMKNLSGKSSTNHGGEKFKQLLIFKEQKYKKFGFCITLFLTLQKI